MPSNQLSVPPKLTAALSQYGVSVANVIEAHPQSFFDFQVYPAAGALAFSFFQNRVGSNGYTQGNTNMPANGQFPNPQNFLWTGTEVFFSSGAAVTGVAAGGKTRLDDWVAVMYAPATASMVINTKEYAREAPLAALPQTFGTRANISIADPALLLGAMETPYGDLSRTSGLLITSNTSFGGTITFDALVPTPSTVAGRIGMKIHGIWYQAAQ